MNIRFLAITIITIFLSACSAPKSIMHVKQDQQVKDPSKVTIHLVRPKSWIGGGVSYLVTDAGEGAEYNSVMAASAKNTYYLGPLLKSQVNIDSEQIKKLSFFTKAFIGRPHNVCGFKVKELPAEKLLSMEFSPSSILLTKSGEFICPTTWGEYDLVSPKATVDSSWGTGNFNQNVQMSKGLYEQMFRMVAAVSGTGTLSFLTSTGTGGIKSVEARKVNYKLQPVAVIGELTNGGSLTWTRPPGTLLLNGNYCTLGCKTDEPENSGLILHQRSPFPYKLEAGKEYYVRMDNNARVKFSDKPFK